MGTLTLTDLIIKKYEESNDPSKLIAHAAAFEQKASYEDAFKLYEKIDDKEGMQRVAKRCFIKGLFLDTDEKLVKKSGLELTPDLYNKRGYHKFKRGYYDDAFEAYQKAENLDGMKKSASKLKKTNELNEAFKCYLILDDNKSAYDVVRKKFIRDLFSNSTKEMFEKLGITITDELWNERGKYQHKRGNLDEAVKAY